MTNPKLLPCPFCGVVPQIYRVPGDTEGSIACINGLCFGPKTTAAHIEDASLQWNKRPALSPPEPTEGQVDAGADAILDDWVAHSVRPENIPNAKRVLARAVLGAAALRAMPLQDHGWRPISTAPKDWTAILLFNSRHPSHPPVVGRFATEPGEPHWCDAATLNGEALYFNSNYFDFWQPTPASPVILAEDQTSEAKS